MLNSRRAESVQDVTFLCGLQLTWLLKAVRWLASRSCFLVVSVQVMHQRWSLCESDRGGQGRRRVGGVRVLPVITSDKGLLGFALLQDEPTGNSGAQVFVNLILFI